MKILPLKGYKALRALNAFHALLLGLKMLPAYIGESYDSFFESFKAKSEAEKEKAIRQAVVFVQLAQDEVEAMVCFACDKNDVPYSAANTRNLAADELFEIIVAVCLEIGKIKVELLTEDEKKKIPTFSIDLRAQYLKHPDLPLQELINLSFLEASYVYRSALDPAKTGHRRR